jgi:hypothetical protein
MNNYSVFSIAGIWSPVHSSYLSETNNGSVNSLSSLIKINGSDKYSIILNCWGWQGGFGGDVKPERVSIALLTENELGNFKINTSNYIFDVTTNGGNSIVVADFNNDGKEDIFLAGHNESPFVAVASTAYLSNSSGTFSKITLSDNVMAHDAQLSLINGKPSIVTTTYQPGDSNPIYQYSNGKFIETQTNADWFVGGMSTSIASFGANGRLELVRSDVMSGWNEATKKFSSSLINVYSFNGFEIASSVPIQSIIPYLSKLDKYKNFSSEWGSGITHTYRLWTDDLNNDGNLDLLAGMSMWSSMSKNYPSAIQVLINNGDGTFKDMTELFNPIANNNSEEFDYNPSFIDIDNSGINTYLFSAFGYSSDERQSNYILLNDGTGKLYISMHDQFIKIAQEVFDYIDNQYINLYLNKSVFPKFIAIPQKDGSLNFVAEVLAGSWADAARTIWSC